MWWQRTMSVGVASVALGLSLAACGSSGSSGTSSGSSGGATLSAQNVAGVGTVLTGPDGKTVYFADQEANGQIKCSGTCNDFWKPVTVASGSTLTAGSGVSGTLATLTRPDGSVQVTYDGKPLYTFVQDNGPGQSSGNGFMDSFNSTAFTWHADTPSGVAAGSAPSTNGGSGNNGYGNGY